MKLNMQKKNVKKNVKQEDTIIKDVNEDTAQIRKFVIILFCVAVVSFLLYFISSKYLIKDGVHDEASTPEETLSYSNVNVGNIFNRPYDEYYILAYDPDSLEASYYASLLNNFDIKKGKIYFLDLSNSINKKYIGEESNKKAKNPSEIKLKEPTLIKIKNAKIDVYLDSRDEIDKELNK